MKKLVLCCVLLLIVPAVPAFSADVMEKFDIATAMEYKDVKELFSGDVAFYWGDQAHPAVEKTYGNFKASKRTNALGKSRGDACAWAMASALDALQKRAQREGGNAVINIVSNIKNNPESSQTEFSCLAGTMMVNVALKGDVVKLAK